jgi:hypothetical protein
MKMTDYKKYSLGQVENFLYDAMSSGATPQEIYDVIKGVVEDNYYTYKKCASEAYELLALLNGNGVGHIQAYDDTELVSNIQYTEEELDAMCAAATSAKKGKVNKWVLPVEYIDDESFVSLPDDLLEAANLKEGDIVNWIDQGDGSFKMIKVTNK